MASAQAVAGISSDCGDQSQFDALLLVAVSVSLATEQASIPASYRLYLPEIWASDPERRKQAGVPKEIRFQTKPEIALGQIRLLVAEGVPHGVVLADAGRGRNRSACTPP
jgi:SRSO17 transposase